MRAHGTEEVYMYACTFTEGKACMGWKIKVLVRGFGPRYWFEVFGPRYWSEVLVQGIWSEVLVQGIWSEVLVLSGFGPRY